MLGGMAYELDSEASERLRKLYAAMSDTELLDLASQPENLTDIAQVALHSEMASRRIEAPKDTSPGERRWAADSFADSTVSAGAAPAVAGVTGAAPVLDEPQASDEHPGESYLIVFYDAIKAGHACEALEAAEIWFRLEDISQPKSGTFRSYDSPPVVLRISVRVEDHDRAVAMLRKEMGLFPLPEVAEPDPVVDDGTVMPVGFFARREDASAVAAALQQAGIWQRVSENPDGSAENEDAWLLEVREVDLSRAGDVVEKALGLA